MALYFDQKIQVPQPSHYTDIQWHNTQPILAVASYDESFGGIVNLFTDEGEHLPDSAQTVCRPAVPTCMHWHTSKRLLVVGFDSGEFMVWNEAERECHERHEQAHVGAKLVLVRWTGSGNRLITGDKTGRLIMWKSDSKGRLQRPNNNCYNMKEPLAPHIVFKPPPPPDPSMDITALARAAVSGDESALDMFNWKQGSKSLTSASQDSFSFFVGSETGNVYMCDDTGDGRGQLSTVFKAEGPVMRLLYHDEKNVLVTVTQNMMLTQHSVSPDTGELREVIRVKLSGRGERPDIIWTSEGILATATGEPLIRMWDVDKEENFVLTLDPGLGYAATEGIGVISYNKKKGLLAAGTNLGSIAMWRYSSLAAAAGSQTEPEHLWQLQPPVVLEGAVSVIHWGSSRQLLGATTGKDVFVLTEQSMCACMSESTGVVQTGPNRLSIHQFTSPGIHAEFKAEIQIKGCSVTKEHLLAWSGKRVMVYELSGSVRPAGTFSSEAMIAAIFEQNVYTVEQGKVLVRTFQGTVKQTLSFTEAEGEPCCLAVCSSFLVVGTAFGFVRLYDLSRRDAKLTGQPKSLSELIPGFRAINSAKCNCNGTRVSVIVIQMSGAIDPKLYVWDTELDTLQHFNLETGRGEQDDLLQYNSGEGEESSVADRGRQQAAKDVAGRHALDHFWDHAEPKLLVLEAALNPVQPVSQPWGSRSQPDAGLLGGKAAPAELVEVMDVTLFVTPENGILMQDAFSRPNNMAMLMGVEVPFFFFARKTDDRSEDTAIEENTKSRESSQPQKQRKKVARKLMRDFVGLEHSSKQSREAMLDFSYYLTIGNMDEAFKAIKLIKSESVWENMARMCVKSRRLDVAAVCLGNMSNARAAKALRESQSLQELDARVAILALQLGLNEDAERLMRNSKRFDLLNELYQAQGQWDKAMEVAETYDRVHLRTTYYNYAKHLEAMGAHTEAIPHYEKSDTHRFEIPRMLFDEPQLLEPYILKTKDKQLRKWWAQYMESNGELETALKFYESAQDFLALVRVHCYCGHLEKAAQICNETGDRAACFHLARQYENQGMHKEALHFFQRARAYGNAIRVCKEQGLEEQMVNLALLGRAEDQLEAARHLEQVPGREDKAVMLYHKAGLFTHALQLAFDTRQFSALGSVSEDVDESTDPGMLQKLADFFTENHQFDKAVEILASARKYWDALKLCMEHGVEMSEELAEKLTLPKAEGEANSEERLRLLEAVAEVAMHQRQYHIATKKFTQAGNKLKAMKALLKSGDTEKIVFFAQVSRQKEIYVMAANYLQSLDWRKDTEIMKNIIGFYTKGRALDLLSGFYDACSQVEIDEYQNYEKALGALNEAAKCVSKAKMADADEQEEKLARLKHKMMLIKKFVQARRAYDESPEEALKQCHLLLEEPDLNSSVRIGDVYGFIIEHYTRREKWRPAYNALEELRSRLPNVNLAYYVPPRSIEAIHRALDLPVPRHGPATLSGGEKPSLAQGDHGEAVVEGEEVDEEVPDESDETLGWAG